jgi:TRAP-type C4-dicarboxylate transport system permease large subunit
MKDILATVGKVAFVVGVLFAIFGGIWGGKAAPTNHAVIAVLLIAGVLIGFLNITAKETWVVLMATVGLLILAIWANTSAFQPVLDLSQGLGENLIGVLDAFALLMAPAAIIIAVKAVIATARPGD